jgi:hypothetical protein
MQHALAAVNGLCPARVADEIGGDEGQAVGRFGSTLLEQGANVTLALQAPDRRAHLMARRQELQDAMAADEARTAGHQNGAHWSISALKILSLV